MPTDYREMVIEDLSTENYALECQLVAAERQVEMYRGMAKQAIGELAVDRWALEETRKRLRQVMGVEPDERNG